MSRTESASANELTIKSPVRLRTPPVLPDEFYGTHPEDGVSEDCAPLLDGLEPSGSPGTLKIELDLSSGALAAAQIFPQVKDRLTEKEYLDWMRAFLDTGDEILGR